MTINTKKTKIMHIHGPSFERSEYVLAAAGQILNTPKSTDI